MKLEELYSIIKGVLPNKVFYGTNVYDNGVANDHVPSSAWVAIE